MPRKNTSTVLDHGTTDESQQALLQSTANQLAEHSNEVMNAFGDGLPYERNRIVNETRFYMAQSAEAMLEAGKRLVILKEHEAHGEFENILQAQIGIPERTAQRMMQSAIKYLSPALQSKAPALALLGKTKLFELITEDDEQLAALVDGGTIAGMSLDDIDRMTSRELRKALREAREDIAAKDQVIGDKNRKIDEVSTKLKKIKKASPDEDAVQYRQEVASIESEIEEKIRAELRPALMQISEHADETGIDHSKFIAAQLDLLDRAILQMRAELGVERDANLGAEWESSKDAA